MDRDAAVARIKSRLQRSTDTALDTSIINEMQFVQQYILEEGSFLPWFLLTDYTDAGFITVANTETVAVPTNFLREAEEGALWIDNSADDPDAPWVEVPKDDYDALRNSSLYDGTGKPKRFALVGNNLYLKKTPDAAYLLRMLAFFKDTVLSTNIENNWLKYAADWVIAETGVIMALNYIRDDIMTQAFAAQAGRARNRVHIENEARAHANRNYQMGDD